MSNILIVDDHPPSRQFLATLLEYTGHRVTEASDGESALACVQADRPDLVISDIQMPRMDGRAFVQKLKSDAAYENLPVIFYTATFREKQAKEIAESCGVKLVITKPSEPEVILRTVHDVLGPDLLRHCSGTEAPIATMHATSLQLSAVIELGTQMLREKNPGELLELFCHGVRSIIGAQFLTLAVVDRNGGSVRFIHRGYTPAAAGELQPPLNAYLCSLIDRHRNGEMIEAELQKRGSELPFRVSSPDSFLAVPIASDKKTYGWLYLAGKSGDAAFTIEDHRMIVTLAAQLTVAYENLALVEDLRNSTERFRESESKYRECISNASCGICRTDRYGKLLLANPALVEMLGYETEDGLLKATGLPFEKIARDHAEAVEVPPVEAAWLKANAGTITLQISGHAAMAGNVVEGFDFVVENITSRHHLEQQLRQAQKMEAVGRLAGGVAHDFNNLLTIILGYANLMLEESEVEAKSRAGLQEIKKAGDRAAALTRQLLAFSRRDVVTPSVLNLNEVVAHTESMLRRIIGEDIELEFTRGADLQPVKADAGQIEQVLLNLAVNARDAMPHGGKLKIETSNNGEFVKMEITDSGSGMPPEVLSRVFEPFFTTKSSGTGLGLSTVYGIVHQSGGDIEAASVVGQGTTFRIYIPRTTEIRPALNTTVESRIIKGSETILVVEDEKMVRELAVMTLKRCGYQVLSAGSGEEAVQICSQHPGPIDLLLTDVVMPRMSGRELRDRVIHMRPDTKVLFMSGYLDDAVVRHGIREAEVAFLPKPFRPEDLANKIREVLSCARAAVGAVS